MANAIYDHAPAEVRPYIHRKLIGPPLGLLTLATAAAPRHEVHLLELKAEYDLRPHAPPPETLLLDKLRELRPELVATTVIASELPAALDLMRAVKAHDPSIKTLAGGLHAILCPGDMEDPALDLVSNVQDPTMLVKVADALEDGTPLAAIGGLMQREHPASPLRATPAPVPACDPAGLDYLPPARELVRPWLPAYVVGKARGPSTYLFTSLGCPNRCSFCSIWPQHGGKFFQRPPASIVQEMRTLDDYEVVRFADANTVVNLGWVAELVQRLAAEDLGKTLIMDIRADTAARHPGLIRDLARVGLKVVIMGFESFREEELRAYNKEASAASIKEAVKVLHDNGVLVRGNYVIPPDYGPEDFKALADFASDHAVALAGYTILTPMPGTSLYEELKPEIIDPDLSRYNFFNGVLRTPHFSLDRFHREVGKLWRIRLGEEVI